MNGNRIKSLRDPVDGTDAVTKQYADSQNKLDSIEGITITGNPSNTDLLMFTGTNSTDYLGNKINGAVNVALDTTTNTTSGSRIFGEPSGTGSDVRFTRAGNAIQIALATGSIKNADVSEEAQIAQTKLNMNLATARASANAGGRAISGITLNNPLRITTSSAHDLVTGDLIGINNVAGTIELNANFYYVSKVDNTNIELYSDAALTSSINGTTGFTAYISGGFITNSLLIQDSSGLVSFNNSEFVLDNGWASLKTSTGLSDGVALTKITQQAASSVLGVPAGAGSSAAVQALTPAQVRTIANVEDGADVTDYNNVKTAGAIMKDGTVSMNDATTLRVVNIEPKVDNTTDNGSSTKYWNDTYTTTVNTEVVKKKSNLTNLTIQNSAGTAALTIAEIVANSTFEGSAAKLTTARTIQLTGAVTGSVTFDGSGNVSLSTTVNHNHDADYVNVTGDTLTGQLNSRAIVPTANTTYNLGSASLKWDNVYANLFQGTATSARFADLAENYLGDNTYEPGTVIVFGGQNEVTHSTEFMTTKIAGVVSTNPAHLMNAEMPGDFVVAVALQGRVPCKVQGKINKGDMLVASDVPGVAVANDNPKLGSVIGKALENYDSTEIGTIEVVVGRL
jgi:hypothetical protein